MIQHMLSSGHAAQQQGTGNDTIIPLHGKVYGLANDSTVEILYQLGTIQDAHTQQR